MNVLDLKPGTWVDLSFNPHRFGRGERIRCRGQIIHFKNRYGWARGPKLPKSHYVHNDSLKINFWYKLQYSVLEIYDGEILGEALNEFDPKQYYFGHGCTSGTQSTNR